MSSQTCYQEKVFCSAFSVQHSLSSVIFSSSFDMKKFRRSLHVASLQYIFTERISGHRCWRWPAAGGCQRLQAMRTWKPSSRLKNRRVKPYCNTCFKACLISLVAGLLVISFALVFGFHDGSYVISDFLVLCLGRLQSVQHSNSQDVQFFESGDTSPNNFMSSQKLTDSAQMVEKADEKSFWQKAQLSSVRHVNYSSPRALIEARSILDSHPFNHLPANQTIGELSLQEAMLYLSKQPQCKKKPIFTSMAQVGTDLYWQLIENFIFSMVKFSISDCSVMICVTDMHCMDLCKKAGFPCLYYDHVLHNPKELLPSALEQIAHLKLFHLPKALSLGVRQLYYY